MKAAALRPTADRILVRRIKGQEKTPGGLYLPDAAQKQTQYGTVIRVGPGKLPADATVSSKRIPVSVEPGQIVLFTVYGGNHAPDPNDKDEYLVLNESDVLGIVPE
jgi:chaperonin GroES